MAFATYDLMQTRAPFLMSEIFQGERRGGGATR
jgi:hypothetical protein